MANRREVLASRGAVAAGCLVKKNWSIDNAGYASLPQGPGIGCEIDEVVLAEPAKKPSPPEWPTHGRLPDGSISDY